MPGIKWGSSSDLTDELPGLKCSALEQPLPGSSLQSFHTWWNLARLIAEL